MSNKNIYDVLNKIDKGYISPSDAIYNDLTVAGNLLVNGDQTILNTTTVELEDPIIQVNKTGSGLSTEKSGIEVYRGVGNTKQRLIFDDSTDKWKAGLENAENNIILGSSLTQGSIPYADGSGNLTENNSGLYFSGSNVGIGTNTTEAKLTINGATVDTTITDTSGHSLSGIYKAISFKNTGRNWFIGEGQKSTKTQNFSLLSCDVGTGVTPTNFLSFDCLNTNLYLSGNQLISGNVGIGTISPQTQLDVSNSACIGTPTASGVFSIGRGSSFEYPPIALTSNSTTISGHSYGDGSYTASASSVQSGLQPWLIFDKNANTHWASENVYVGGSTDYAGNTTTPYNTSPSLTYLGEWVQIQLPTSVIMKSFILTVANVPDPVSPRDFAIFGSNNGGSTWTSIFSVTGEPFNRAQSKTFIVSNTTAYTHYRLAVNKRNRINDPYWYIQIAEWRILGYLPNQTNTLTATIDGNIGIGTTTPDTSSTLDLTSTTKGFLPPRLSANPASPASGLVYYNTTDNTIKYYNGSTWTSLTASSSTIIQKGFTFNGQTSFCSWGDSWGDLGGSSGWNVKLAGLASKTLISNNVSGTRTDYPFSTDSKLNTLMGNTLDAFSQIIVYGINDFSLTGSALYGAKQAWKEVQLNLILACCLPSSVKSNPRDASWTKSGTTANIGLFTTWGIDLQTVGGYIEKSLTGRYLVVGELVDTSLSQYSVSINGTVFTTITKRSYAGTNAYPGYCSVIDFGSSATRTVRLTVVTLATSHCYFTHIACFDQAHAGNKNTLISNIPYIPNSDGVLSRLQREGMNLATFENVNYCKNVLGLNVYMYDMASFYTNSLMSSDGLHPTATGFTAIAQDMLTNYIS